MEDQTGNPDPKTNFRLIVVQTELERFKYLVRAYLQTRLAKVSSRFLTPLCDLRSLCPLSLLLTEARL